MAFLNRLRITWSGLGLVGDGLTTFYTTGGTVTSHVSAKTFFTTCAGLFPNVVTLSIPNSGDIINDNDGSLAGTWVGSGSPQTVTGTTAGAWAMGVGMQVRWKTAGVVGGRRVVGSTFLVPATANHYDTNGTIVGTDVTTVQGAVNAFIASEPTLTIWSRPTATRSGTSNVVVSGLAPDRVAWLRTRRT